MKMNRAEVEKQYVNMVWVVAFSHVSYASCLPDLFTVSISINCISTTSAFQFIKCKLR